MKATALVIAALLASLIVPCGFAEEPEPESEEQFLLEVLESNLRETAYTALVRITKVEKKGREMLYPTYLFTGEVLETYRGKSLKKVQYLRGIEQEPESFPIGKTHIVSLFFNQELHTFFMGDNAYDLPASDALIEAARRFSNPDEDSTGATEQTPRTPTP